MKTLPFWARLCLLLSLVAGVLPHIACATSGPTITTQPQPGSVTQGASATLSVVATASGTITYQWELNGQVIPGATMASLAITNAQFNESGNYDVIVSAGGVSVTSVTANLVVVIPPSFDLQIVLTRTVIDGGSLLIPIPVVGTPLTFVWTKDGTVIPNQNSNTLSISPVVPASAGSYVLTISNSAGTTSSSPVVVSVAEPIVITGVADVTADPGSTVTITPTVVGPGTLTYQWYGPTGRISGATQAVLTFTAGSSQQTGEYYLGVSNADQTVFSSHAVVSVNAAPYFTLGPTSGIFSNGYGISLSAIVQAVGTVTYQWQKDGVPLQNSTRYKGATSSELFVGGVLMPSDEGVYTVVATNAFGSTTSAGATVTILVDAYAPAIITQPASVAGSLGGNATFTVVAEDPILNDTMTFAWSKDAQPIPGAINATLTLDDLSASDAGSYTVSITNSSVTVTSSPAVLTVTALPTARVINLSTRAQVGTGDNILIAGFIINGSSPKKMLVRAVGPALTNYGISNFLADPSLKIVDSNGNTVARNDDWGVTSDLAGFTATSTQVGAVPFAAGSKDSALVATLAPGGYTALVTGNNNTTGVALVELYEVDTNTTNQLINISSRAQVGTGASVTIAGVIVSGNAPQKFLVRAIGPGLQARGVSAFLPDPQFDIVDSSSSKTIATNDDWETSATVADVKAVTATMGVSPLAAGSKDSALTITLAPGGYTVVVRGSNNSSGIALVELYQVP